MTLQFSIVMPVKSEGNLLRYSLPSCYRLHPDEVILCLDDPPDPRLVALIRRISNLFGHVGGTRVVPVRKNSSYRFHQAWARRQGFRSAKYDRILTTDDDLILRKNVLKTAFIVGQNNIGLASCATLHSISGLFGLWRVIAHRVADFVSTPGIMGLYSIWRPYWEDSEDEGIKQLPDLRREEPKGSHAVLGEDIYLRNCMQKKHAAVHLRDIGAYNMRPDWPDRPYVQFELGRFYRESMYSLGSVALRSVAFVRPHLLRGYLYQS